MTTRSTMAVGFSRAAGVDTVDMTAGIALAVGSSRAAGFSTAAGYTMAVDSKIVAGTIVVVRSNIRHARSCTTNRSTPRIGIISDLETIRFGFVLDI